MTTAKKTKRKSAAAKGFSAEEKAAMKDRARELKSGQSKGKGKGDGESVALAKIAELEPPDRALAERIHALVKTAAP